MKAGPNDESLVAGCNAKSYPHTAIGRHGTFLQWGYGAPPSKMTEDGRKLLVNCICYIRKFAGGPPLVRRQSLNRRCAFHYRAFSLELEKRYEGRRDELYQLHKENVELLYERRKPTEKGLVIMFPIDFELKNLGIDSNRRISTLEKLIALLPDDAGADEPAADEQGGFSERLKAKRRRKNEEETPLRLLRRYTNVDFKTKIQWQQWLAENRDRLFFSDFGGYKFYVIPKDYPLVTRADPNAEPFWFPR